jgi:polyhydroxyalkanoic acid synthase PhaR subunit
MRFSGENPAFIKEIQEMPGETQAQATSAESWKHWQEAWKAFYETVSKMWPQARAGMDMQELPAPWFEMMEEVRVKMQMEENTNIDPVTVLKHWYDTSGEKWSKAFGDAIVTKQFVEAMSSVLESYTSFSKMFRRACEVYFSNLQLPTRSDIARLAGLVVNLEEKVDRIEDSLESLGNDSAQVSTGASLQRLEARLGQVESKLERVLAALEKMEKG